MMLPMIVKAALPYLIVLFLFSGIVFKVYDYGYDRAWDKQQLRYEELVSQYERASTIELNRQNEANRKAREYAKALLQELKDAEENLRLLQERLDEEARSDPDGDRPAISRDGVLRLNRIR